MAEEVIIDISIQGNESLAQLNKLAVQTQTAIAKLQLEAKKLKKDLNTLTMGTTEYNDAMNRSIVVNNQLVNAKKLNQVINKTLVTSNQQLKGSTDVLTAAETELKAAFDALNPTMVAYAGVTDANTKTTIDLTNSLEEYSMRAQAAGIAQGTLNNAAGKGDAKWRANNNLMLNFNQVLRETPNFAMSARIGIMSLSNNLPMLADAISSARAQGMTMIEMLKGLKTAMFSFTGVLTLLTVALTALTNPAVLKWLKELFSGVKETTIATYELATANEVLLDTYKNVNSVYGKFTQNTTKVTEIMKLAKEGLVDQKDALELYNETFGESLGVVKTFDEAYAKMIDTVGSGTFMSKELEKQTQAMKDLSIAEGFLDEQTAGRVRLDKLRAIANIYFDTIEEIFSEKDMGIIFDKLVNEDAMNNIRTVMKELVSEETFKEYLTYTEERNKNDQDWIKKLKEGFDLTDENGVVMKSYTAEEAKNSQGFLRFMIQRQEKEQEWAKIVKDNINNRVVKDAKSYEEALKNYKEYLRKAAEAGRIIPKAEEKDKKDDPIKALQLPSDKDVKVWADKIETELNGAYTRILNLTSKFSKEQQVIFAEATRTRAKFFDDTEIYKIDFDRRMMEGRMTDLLSEKRYLESQLINNVVAFTEQKKLYNERNYALNNYIRNEEEARRKLNDTLNVLEQHKAKLVAEFNADQDKEEKKQNKTRQAQIIEEVKGLNEKIDLYKKETDAIDFNLKKKKQELDTMKEQASELDKLGDLTEEQKKKLEELMKEIPALAIAIEDNIKDRTRAILDTIGVFTDAMGDLFNSLGDMYETNMDLTNQKYDLEEKRIKGSVLAEEEKNRQLAALDQQRYEALKKDFERSKKARIAGAYMDLASGLVTIASKSMELGPILGPIFGAISAAALVLTTRNSVKKIKAERLDAPSGGGMESSSSSSKLQNVKALQPAQTAMISPQENLNQSNRNSTAWVRVSEINSVQNKVKVRELNQSF